MTLKKGTTVSYGEKHFDFEDPTGASSGVRVVLRFGTDRQLTSVELVTNYAIKAAIWDKIVATIAKERTI